MVAPSSLEKPSCTAHCWAARTAALVDSGRSRAPARAAASAAFWALRLSWRINPTSMLMATKPMRTPSARTNRTSIWPLSRPRRAVMPSLTAPPPRVAAAPPPVGGKVCGAAHGAQPLILDGVGARLVEGVRSADGGGDLGVAVAAHGDGRHRMVDERPPGPTGRPTHGPAGRENGDGGFAASGAAGGA